MVACYQRDARTQSESSLSGFAEAPPFFEAEPQRTLQTKHTIPCRFSVKVLPSSQNRSEKNVSLILPFITCYNCLVCDRLMISGAKVDIIFYITKKKSKNLVFS